jgi:hypothetical protein
LTPPPGQLLRFWWLRENLKADAPLYIENMEENKSSLISVSFISLVA